MGALKEYAGGLKEVFLKFATIYCYFDILNHEVEIKKEKAKDLSFVVEEEDYSARLSLENKVFTFSINVPGLGEKTTSEKLGLFMNYAVGLYLKAIHGRYEKNRKIYDKTASISDS